MKKIMVIGLLVLATSVQAENYVPVDKNQYSVFAVDVDSIETVHMEGNSIKTFNTIFNFYAKDGAKKQLGPKFKNASYMIVNYSINCRSKQFITNEAKVYSYGSKLMYSEGEGKINKINPNTFIHSAMNKVCN